MFKFQAKPNHPSYVVSSPPMYTAAMSAYPYSVGLESVYKFTSKFDEEVCGAIREGNTLLVPRESAPISPNDYRASHPPKAIDCTVTFRHEQGPKCAEALGYLEQGRSFVFSAPTAFGKCQLKDETVLMYTGELKKVQDVVVGDRLMGPDSTPRTVLALGSGKMLSYELRTHKGECLRFNEDHILSLKRTRYFQKDGTRSKGKWRGGEIEDISIKDYLKKSKNYKHLMKLYKPEVVHFPVSATPLLVDPYVLGLFLGDGGLSQGSVLITKKDPEVISAVAKEVAKFGCSVKKCSGDKGDHTYRVYDGSGVNRFKRVLQETGIYGHTAGTKFVPPAYKTASLGDRLQLIAGLIDTDGHHSGGCFDWVSKSEVLADDLCYLCHSVGLAAVKKPCKKQCTNTGVWGDYWRVCVSGDNTIIPTRIERKRAKPRKSKKSVLVHGFKITPLGEQEYFGFTLDGDRRYLTGNFFVTHNTVCLGYVAAKFGQPTLIVVTKEDLARQWKDSLINVLKIPPSLVGHIQQDTCDWEGKRFVVGTVQSLIIPDRYPTAMYKYFGLMVLDECHLMASECFVRVCQIFPAKYRVGVSATPTRKDGKTKLLDWHIGPTLVTGTVVSMKPKVLVSNTGWAIPNRPVKVQGDLQMRPIPHSPGRMMQVFKALASNEARNLSIAEFVVQAYNKGRTCLILSDLKEYHLDRLFQLITSAGVPGNEIGYYVGGMSEQELKRTKKCRVALGTYAMCSTGTDVPQWDTLVMATPRADVKQSVGRVLRFQEGKKTPVVLDLVDKDSIFRGFHRARLTQYHSLGAEIVEVGG